MLMLKKLLAIPILGFLVLVNTPAQASQQEFMEVLQQLSLILRHNADFYSRLANYKKNSNTNQAQAITLLNYASKIDTMLSVLSQGADNYDAQDEYMAKIFLFDMKKRVTNHLQADNRKAFTALLKQGMIILQKDFDM